MQVFSRHSKFSIVIITQNIYQPGPQNRNIRLNCDLIALGRNYCDNTVNIRISRTLGVEDQYAKAAEDSEDDLFNFVLINNATSCPSSSFRVGSNLFDEYPSFYLKNPIVLFIHVVISDG